MVKKAHWRAAAESRGALIARSLSTGADRSFEPNAAGTRVPVKERVAAGPDCATPRMHLAKRSEKTILTKAPPESRAQWRPPDCPQE